LHIGSTFLRRPRKPWWVLSKELPIMKLPRTLMEQLRWAGPVRIGAAVAFVVLCGSTVPSNWEKLKADWAKAEKKKFEPENLPPRLRQQADVESKNS